MAVIFSSANRVLAFIPAKCGFAPQQPEPQRPLHRAWSFLEGMEGKAPISDCFVKCKCGGCGRESHIWKRDIVQGIIEICRCSYWERLWIIQEVVSARKLLLTNGIQRIKWATLQLGLQKLKQCNKLSQDQQDELSLSIPFRVQELRTGQRRASLVALLSDYGSQKCRDFHDHVHGLLSIAINGHRYPVDYKSSKLQSLFTTIEFCRKHGAYLPEETELFSVASTICSALSIDLELLMDSSPSFCNIEDIECRALLSPFKITTTVKQGYQRNAPIECHCCHLSVDPGALEEAHYLLCLADEGAGTHLLFRKAENFRQEARLITAFPPHGDGPDPDRVLVNVEEKVTDLSLSPSPAGLYYILRMTPAAFLRILRHEHTNLDDILPRTQQLCIISEGDSNTKGGVDTAQEQAEG
ncbi:hypothetical protein RBB50_012446 [Rhinocladiella similis]